MNPSIKDIMSQVYEMEGLLLVVSNHQTETPAIINEMIQQKDEKKKELSAVINT